MGKGHKKWICCSEMAEQKSSPIFKISTEPRPVADTTYTHPCGKYHLGGSQCPIQTAQTIPRLSLLERPSTHLLQQGNPSPKLGFCSIMEQIGFQFLFDLKKDLAGLH